MKTETLELAIRIANALIAEVGVQNWKPDSRVGQHVLIRTYSAGVHFGRLKFRNGTEATLSDARRIWSWKGANTLNEIATKGIDQSASNVSQPVPEIDLTNVIEVIPLSEAARSNLEGCTWRNK